MKSSQLKLLIAAGLIAVIISCNRENVIPESFESPQLPAQTFDYKSVMDEVKDFSLPNSLLSATESPFGEEIFTGGEVNTSFQRVDNDEIATIGRVLFYDKQLSKNNSISCASCHKQELAFADDKALSEGFGGVLTSRNSSTIVNPIVSQNFFWDSRSFSLEDLALRPIQNHVEMGMENIDELTAKLAQSDYYGELFRKAYGSENVTPDRVAESISQFVASIFKRDSKFDVGLESDFSNFSELEKHGMALFFSENTQCAKCHAGANFSTPTSFGNEYEQTGGSTNIGLNVVYEDDGFGDGKFKIPSLRNISLTAPYMHDGRFETLRDVLNHYNDGIQPHEDLDHKLDNNGTPVSMGLTDLDMQAMEAFLNTLTSATITTDERFSNPFD